MEMLKRFRLCEGVLYVLCCSLVLCGCDDEGTGPEDQPTGATLQGTVAAFEAPAWTAGEGQMTFALTPGVLVSIGTIETETDEDGAFVLNNIPLGDQLVSFSKSGAVGNYILTGIERDMTFTFDQIRYSSGQISTAHTGTWVGTGGSTDPGSQGQIALTMILQANGNSLTGTASVGIPDETVWSVSGKETGISVDGEWEVVSTNSPCATGGTFAGAFSADTLSGAFVEVDPPAGCGPPEHGTFRVVKQ